MNASVDFLKDSLTVSPTDDGQVAVTVLLPPDLVREYCRFIDSFLSFFQSVQRKSNIATIPTRSTRPNPDKEAALAAYTSQVVSSFDQYTTEGLDRKTAIRRISADLRAINHPWRFPEQVRLTLVAAGRGGRPGRPRRGDK